MTCRSLQIWSLHTFQPQLPMLASTCLSTLSHVTVPFNSFILSQMAFGIYPTAFLPQDASCTVILSHFCLAKSFLSLQLTCHFSRKAFTDFPHLSEGLTTSLLLLSHSIHHNATFTFKNAVFNLSEDQNEYY